MFVGMFLSFAFFVTVNAHMPASCQVSVPESIKTVVSNVLACAETTSDTSGSDQALCVERELDMLRNSSDRCMTCLEHFVTDHLSDITSECLPKPDGKDITREDCVDIITSALLKDCF
jgi:hypothetical protein